MKKSRKKNKISKLCEKQGKNSDRVFATLGSLGGGNHFIEIDADTHNNRWLLIHSGSRIFGANTAEYHETLALRETEYIDCAHNYIDSSEKKARWPIKNQKTCLTTSPEQ